MQRSYCETQSLSTDSSIFTVQQNNESVHFSELRKRSLQNCFAIIQCLAIARSKTSWKSKLTKRDLTQRLQKSWKVHESQRQTVNIMTRMMRDHLKEVLKEKSIDSSEGNFKLSTISLFNVRRILRVYLDFTWWKWRQKASRWIENYSDKRRLFADIIKKLESIGFYMIYVD